MNSSCKDKTSVLKEDLLIVSQREIAPRIFEMKLSGEMVLDMAPGQFLHLRVPDPSKLYDVRFRFVRLIRSIKWQRLFTE